MKGWSITLTDGPLYIGNYTLVLFYADEIVTFKRMKENITRMIQVYTNNIAFTQKNKTLFTQNH